MSSSNWPQSFDTFHDPSSTTRMNDPVYGHAAQHTLTNDAITNIEQFLGLAATPNFIATTNTTTAIPPASGAAGPLPATPNGYLEVTINGQQHYIAYY